MTRLGEKDKDRGSRLRKGLASIGDATTARNSMFFSLPSLALSLVPSLVLFLCIASSNQRNLTSAFDPVTLAPNDLNTSLRAATGSVAVMAETVTTPRATKPRARASAICPAPMNPTRLLRDIV